MLGKEIFGAANILECTEVLPLRGRASLGQYDPAVMRETIRVPEIRENLFPTIRSGVRFWPFLLVAHELRDEGSRTRVEQHLRELRRRQRKHQDRGRFARAFGPRTATTFAAYRSMYRNVMASATGDGASLRSFLYTRRRYRGDPSFFIDHAQEWRTALRRSMGAPGQQFARLLDRLHKEESDSGVVDRAITMLLRTSSFDGWLRKAAFCYAFLRCVYGITASVEGIRSFVPISDWAELLATILPSHLQT